METGVNVSLSGPRCGVGGNGHLADGLSDQAIAETIFVAGVQDFSPA